MKAKDENYFFSTYQQLVANKNREFLLALSGNSSLNQLVKPFLRQVAAHLWRATKGSQFTDFSILKYQKLNEKFLQLTMASNLDKKYKQYPEWKNALNDGATKFLRRLFLMDGYNDEKYIFQSDIQEWLSDSLALVIVEDKRFEPIGIIKKVLFQTSMLNGFYRNFLLNIPNSWVTENVDQWISIDNDESFFSNAVYKFSKNYFDNYEQNWQKVIDKDQYKSIQKATEYSEYGHLSEEYGFRNFTLFHKDKNFWLLFWDNLTLPLLQEMALRTVSTVYDIIHVGKLLSNLNPKLRSSRKQLAFLLLKNYFEKSHKISQNLAFYLSEENWPSKTAYDRDDDILAKGKLQAAMWEKERKKNYELLFTHLKPILGYSGLMDWLFSYKYRASGSHYYMEIYNLELEIAKAAYDECFENEASSILEDIGTNINLQKFNFIASNYSTIITHEVAENLLTKLSEFIKQKEFYWEMSLSLASFPAIRSIGVILSKCNRPELRAWTLLKSFNVYFEGWNLNDDYKGVNREVFICCGVILLVEHSEAFESEESKSEFIKKTLNHLIVQTRFADYKESYYNVAFMLLNLVVNQVLPADKLYFEKALIDKLDNLVDVLNILSFEKYQLESEAKTLLQERVDREMIFLKRKMNQINQINEIARLEKIIDNLL